MKKFLAILLALCMVFALAACGEAEPQETEQAEPNGTPNAELTWGLTPFEETQHIRMGLFTGSIHSYMAYFAEQLGVLDALNIDAEFMWFTGGPAMLEAGNDWDICTLGLGGIATGLSTYDYVFIESTDYEDNMAIFVRPDSEIAKDPENPEVWKGAECVYALGTTPQFVLSG